jgi:hypothetical protein
LQKQKIFKKNIVEKETKEKKINVFCISRKKKKIIRWQQL